MSAILTTQQPKNKSSDENTDHSKKPVSLSLLRNSVFGFPASLSLLLSLFTSCAHTPSQSGGATSTRLSLPPRSLWQLCSVSILNSWWWIWAGSNGGSHTYIHTHTSIKAVDNYGCWHRLSFSFSPSPTYSDSVDRRGNVTPINTDFCSDQMAVFAANVPKELYVIEPYIHCQRQMPFCTMKCLCQFLTFGLTLLGHTVNH